MTSDWCLWSSWWSTLANDAQDGYLLKKLNTRNNDSVAYVCSIQAEADDSEVPFRRRLYCEMTVVFNQHCMFHLLLNGKKAVRSKTHCMNGHSHNSKTANITLPQVIVGDRPILFITYEEHILCPRHIVNEEWSGAAINIRIFQA